MIFPVPHLIAAIETQILFAIVVGIISFISWISKAIKEKQGEGKNPEAGVAGEQDNSIRNEIESFLQDVLGQNPQKKQVDEEDFLELVDEEPPRRKKRKKQPQRKTRRQSKQTRIEDRSIGQSASVFGSNLQEHVSTHMQPKHFENNLGHNVDQSVSQHLGVFSGNGDEVQLVSSSDQLRGEVLDMLRNPEDVRKAIVLNLILTPPASLKKN
ncbi:hypothetical protein MNBD_PLANCTO02-3345 [hydrothermal vent metagenome]|uniref:Uncharacterized protein n=1 Tax=hydrothermal vent metagenome TaxID=652676 RepID=A0A3B1DMK1_9ZZZZ